MMQSGQALSGKQLLCNINAMTLPHAVEDVHMCILSPVTSFPSPKPRFPVPLFYMNLVMIKYAASEPMPVLAMIGNAVVGSKLENQIPARSSFQH